MRLRILTREECESSAILRESHFDPRPERICVSFT